MILMEYAQGETLRKLIDDSPGYLTRKVIFDLFTQLMTALKHIHSSGLVHRDIKPENIFVNKRTRRLQVGDFGLAKALKGASDQDLNQSAMLRVSAEPRNMEFSMRDLGGTPMYLSPEQKILNGSSRRN